MLQEERSRVVYLMGITVLYPVLFYLGIGLTVYSMIRRKIAYAVVGLILVGVVFALSVATGFSVATGVGVE